METIGADEIAAELPPAQLGSLGNTTIVFAPGLLTGLLPVLAFQSVWPRIQSRFGVRVLAVDSHPMASTEANVRDLENTIERGIGVRTGTVGKLLLRLAPIIQVQRVDRRLDEYDFKAALRSLTTWYREDFLAENQDMFLELGIPMFYFSGATTIFEVPWFQVQGTFDPAKYDQENDMQLTQEQAKPPLPFSPHLAKFRANHWDLSYDTFPWYASLGWECARSRRQRGWGIREPRLH